MKSDKTPYVIYADIESLIRKVVGCANNPEKFSARKIAEHILCGYSTSTISWFAHIKNKHTLFCGKECMKKFCSSLREHVKHIIDLEKKEMIPLTNKQLKSQEDAKVCYICGKHFLEKLFKHINHWKVRDHCHYTGKYRGVMHSICNLKFTVPNEILVVFHKFSNNDINAFILLIRKGVYLYEYMDDLEKFNETTLPEKKEFYSNLNLEDVTDVDHTHAKGVHKDSEIKKLGDYHHLYLKSDTLLLDVFENFWDVCLRIYELHPVKFIWAPGLAWHVALKKTQVKLDLSTDVDMLLMVERDIRGGACNSIHQYAKANNNNTKDYDKNKESSYLNYWDINKSLRVGNVKKTSNI